VEDRGAEQRALFRRWPAGVSVVVAEVDGRRAALTVSSLVSLSLEPPLVGISIAQQASLHELLRGADEWTASILAGDQERLAQHFARSVPPIALWNGIDVREDDPRLLVGAAGWLVARTVQEHTTGDHTFFVGEIQSIEEGSAPDSLTYVHHSYKTV
jgi:flavin reductase (DIM6/NTAB) family NADH-FMN oxidoreductase RutF